MTARHYTSSSNHTTSTGDSRRSADSYGSRSTALSCLYDSPASTVASSSHAPKHYSDRFEEDVSPSTSHSSSASVDTYMSQASILDDHEDDEDEDAQDDMAVHEILDDTSVPPLPAYRHEITDVNVRPSSPEYFADLFPSMNRLSIRHDDFTSDGNMNLRVDTVVPGRRRRTIQLFHLRMHDLNRREFSLRRYCRDSGREVCNSKRKYTEPALQSRPILSRSMSSAMKSLARPQLVRTNTAGSMFSIKTRPRTSASTTDNEDHFNYAFSQPFTPDKKPRSPQVATNVIKLEFSNYARVDVERVGSKNGKRYEFDWWGHKYAWKRVTDKLTGVVSFHLFRDNVNSLPVAHIVPETRSPNQIMADNSAGGWVPPCHMWLSDNDLIEAVTDVADVVVATGLMALVDDCIKDRWGTKRSPRMALPLRSGTLDFENTGPKAFVQHLFSRRYSDHISPFRQAHHPVRAC